MPQSSRPPAKPLASLAPTVEQNKSYEKAIRLFRAGNFAGARPLFEAAVDGPQREVSHSARSYALMCEKRLAAAAAPQPRTADDHYNLGVALLNRRELPDAESHLRGALDLSKNGDHIHYALALCRWLQGDSEGALEHLKRAIEIEPRNRTAARNDPDFAALILHPSIRDLLAERRPGA